MKRHGTHEGRLLNIDNKYAELSILTRENRICTISKADISAILVDLEKDTDVGSLFGINHIEEKALPQSNNLSDGELPTDEKGNHIREQVKDARLDQLLSASDEWIRDAYKIPIVKKEFDEYALKNIQFKLKLERATGSRLPLIE